MEKKERKRKQEAAMKGPKKKKITRILPQLLYKPKCKRRLCVPPLYSSHDDASVRVKKNQTNKSRRRRERKAKKKLIIIITEEEEKK